MMGRTLTLKGVVRGGERERILYFDSNIQLNGWKIKDVQVNNLVASTVHGLLHTTDTAYAIADWSDNRVVAYLSRGSTGVNETIFNLNHVVVSNLYLTNLSPSEIMCYLITLEEIQIDAKENIIYQLKEIAQNVDNP